MIMISTYDLMMMMQLIVIMMMIVNVAVLIVVIMLLLMMLTMVVVVLVVIHPRQVTRLDIGGWRQKERGDATCQSTAQNSLSREVCACECQRVRLSVISVNQVLFSLINWTVCAQFLSPNSFFLGQSFWAWPPGGAGICQASMWSCLQSYKKKQKTQLTRALSDKYFPGIFFFCFAVFSSHEAF